MVSPKRAMIKNCTFRKSPVTATLRRLYAELWATFMREVACLRNLLNGFVTTLKRLFESVMGTLFCLLLYVTSVLLHAISAFLPNKLQVYALYATKIGVVKKIVAYFYKKFIQIS